MPYWSLLGLGFVVFASTDIDDLLLLVLLLGDRRLSSRQVLLGQYLGFFGLLAISISCSLLAIVIPPAWLGLLGIWPLLIGVYRLWNRSGGDEVGVAAKVAAPTVNVLSVALVTMANGGDNITVYVPLFASLKAGQIAILVAEFLLLIALWYKAAHYLVTHPLTGAATRRIVHAILPYVLIALGIGILARSLPMLTSGW